MQIFLFLSIEIIFKIYKLFIVMEGEESLKNSKENFLLRVFWEEKIKEKKNSFSVFQNFLHLKKST